MSNNKKEGKGAFDAMMLKLANIEKLKSPFDKQVQFLSIVDDLQALYDKGYTDGHLDGTTAKASEIIKHN